MKRTEHRTIVTADSQLEVDEMHDPENLLSTAKIAGRQDGRLVNVGMTIRFFSTWRFWRWITLTNNLTGKQAHAFWPVPHFPPFLFKWSFRRAALKIDPR